MLCYIDIEHDHYIADPLTSEQHLIRRMQEKLRFEQLTALPCLVLRYSFVDAGWLARLNPVAVLISGCQTDWSCYDPQALGAVQDYIRHCKQPLLGICGGHQLIVHAFGGLTGPLRPLQPSELDPDPTYGPSLLKERGVHRVTVLRPDPLFANLPAAVDMVEDHYWAVRKLPPDFENLAMTETCTIQAVRHRQRLIYGTQFHPERFTPEHPHGEQVLRNFFQLVQSNKVTGSSSTALRH